MAVSVRIEDEAFSDRRYDLLARELGLPDADCARGKMAAVWRQCTQQQTHILSIDLLCAVLGQNGPDALTKSGLGVSVEGGIRICGTRGRIEWLAKLRKNARKGGVAKSAKRQANRQAPGSSEEVPDACPPAPAPAPAKEEDLDPADRALTLKLILKIIANHPGSSLTKLTPAKKSERIVSWADHVRKMRVIDKHSEAEISAVIDWCQADEFWSKNILSTETLRRQWDQLIAKMGSKAPRPRQKISEQPALTFMVGDVEVTR